MAGSLFDTISAAMGAWFVALDARALINISGADVEVFSVHIIVVLCVCNSGFK